MAKYPLSDSWHLISQTDIKFCAFLPKVDLLIYNCWILNIPTIYHQVSNISRTLVGNKIVDHSDVVGASPVGAAPTTS